jgi:cytochrome c peroxidase
VFEEQDCVRCHRPPAYTSPRTYDVGTPDEKGWSEFNPPSLLGVSQRPALFHDNRAQSLRDVLVRFRHPEGQPVPASDVEDLLAFLESL